MNTLLIGHNADQLDLSNTNINMDLAKIISSIISNKNCSLTYIKIGNNCIQDINAGIMIFKSISFNKSIKDIDFTTNNFRFSTCELEELIKVLAESIKNHPCIRKLDISGNKIRESLYFLADNCPSSLKYLTIGFNSFLTDKELSYIIKNTNLHTINILGVSPMFLLNYCKSSIEYNRSLINILYSWNYQHPTKDDIINVDRIIEPVLLRNRLMRDKAKKIALQLLLIKKYSTNNNLLLLLPKDIVIIIAKDVFNSYFCDEWYQVKKIKKQKN